MIGQNRPNYIDSAERIETWIQRLIARTGEHRMRSSQPPTCSKPRVWIWDWNWRMVVGPQVVGSNIVPLSWGHTTQPH